jgi:serine/threonine protein kinase
VNDWHDACISDFGLSRILEAEGFTTKSVGGTSRWMAYELVAPPEEGEEEEHIPQVSAATDIWAFGMTALEVRSSISRLTV